MVIWGIILNLQFTCSGLQVNLDDTMCVIMSYAFEASWIEYYNLCGISLINTFQI